MNHPIKKPNRLKNGWVIVVFLDLCAIFLRLASLAGAELKGYAYFL